MKPILILLPVFLLCLLFVFFLPHLIRFPLVREEILPVSVTALGQASQVIDSPLHAISPRDSAPAAEQVGQYDDFNSFAAALINGQAGELVGVYAPGLFALPVLQQPSDRPDFVYQDSNAVTEFSLPKKYGSTGLLAHNYLSGGRFTKMRQNQDILLLYGDGRQEHYRISRILTFQALRPASPFSTFVDVSDPSRKILTSAELFNQVYTTRHQLVFQTCVEANGEPSWGRVFIIASLVEPFNLSVPSFGAMPTVN